MRLQKWDRVYDGGVGIDSDSDPAAMSYAYPLTPGAVALRGLDAFCGLRCECTWAEGGCWRL